MPGGMRPGMALAAPAVCRVSTGGGWGGRREAAAAWLMLMLAAVPMPRGSRGGNQGFGPLIWDGFGVPIWRPRSNAASSQRATQGHGQDRHS